MYKLKYTSSLTECQKTRSWTLQKKDCYCFNRARRREKDRGRKKLKNMLIKRETPKTERHWKHNVTRRKYTHTKNSLTKSEWGYQC
jgi:hypothetical protein